MNRLDHQLDRLLRSASAAGMASEHQTVIPDVRHLLRQREGELAAASAGLSRVLRGGLAFACVLLTLALLLNGRRIQQARNDVFAGPKAVLAQHTTP